MVALELLGFLGVSMLQLLVARVVLVELLCSYGRARLVLL